jgi:sugar/nucleoside kinase (ribokinase family)
VTLSTPALAVLGDLVEDVVVWLDKPLEPATDNPARVFRSRGGSAANVAVLAASRVPTRFIGCVGADPLGDRLDASLRAAGVDPRVERQGRSGSVVVLVDATGERTLLPDRGAATELSEVPEAWLDGIRALHVPAYGFTTEPAASAIRRAIGAATRLGIDVTIDASSASVLRDLGVEAFLALVAQVRPRVLFANALEAETLALSGARPADGAVFVLKDGPRPARIVDARGRVEEVPALPVAAPRDSTGAGDAFAAGYLAARLGGADPVECTREGHALARRVLDTPGAAQPTVQPTEPGKVV